MIPPNALLLLLLLQNFDPVLASTTNDPTTLTTTTATTPDPVRCNGQPPPSGSGSNIRLLSPGVLVYTCNDGLVETGSGFDVIHCDVNATSWRPSKGLVCELPEEERIVAEWVIPAAVAVTASAVLVALLFCLAYSCRACGLCSGFEATRAGERCTCCTRQSRVTPDVTDHVVTAFPVKPLEHHPQIIIYDDYLVRQKRFL